ncbi:MAG: hypothetical protein ABJI96_14780 [Paracoccaceae bacterium]
MKHSSIKVAKAALIFWLLSISPASAYIGPGGGLGALGTLVAILGAGLLLIVGFVWYPVKRLLNRNKKNNSANQELTSEKED